MKKKLVDDLKDSDKIFRESGMINESNTLGYGFFPIASGILLEDQSTFKKCKVLVIGNDFGSKTYLKNAKKRIKENRLRIVQL